MAKERIVWEVRGRFLDEQDYIERYTRFLTAKSMIHDHQVRHGLIVSQWPGRI